MKYFIFLFGLVFGLQMNAQDGLSAYKYIIIPKQFSFQKEPGQYQVNALSKFLFKKYGFEAYISGENLPADANANGCNTLTMEADSGGFLGTHLTYTLANCQGQVVYTSPEGRSKIKEYKGAYHEAMREAMQGLEELGYTYSDEIINVNTKNKETAVAETNASSELPEQQKTSETAENTVVVSATPTTARGNNNVPKNETKNADKSNEAAESMNSSSSTADTYKSADGSYVLKASNTGFDFYEGDKKIGEARKTSAGSYLINTSEFVGVGSLEGDTFIVEREIKGVDGLIKMTFKAE